MSYLLNGKCIVDKTQIEIRGLDRVKAKLRPEVFGPPIRRFLNKSTIHAQKEIRRRTPIDQGRLANSISTKIDPAPVPAWGRVGTNLPYAPQMEYGTGDHFDGPNRSEWRPARPAVTPQLDRWATRHGFKSGAAVAAIIARNGGLKPRRYMREGFAASLRTIRRFAREAAKDIKESWDRL